MGISREKKISMASQADGPSVKSAAYELPISYWGKLQLMEGSDLQTLVESTDEITDVASINRLVMHHPGNMKGCQVSRWVSIRSATTEYKSS